MAHRPAAATGGGVVNTPWLTVLVIGAGIALGGLLFVVVFVFVWLGMVQWLRRIARDRDE